MVYNVEKMVKEQGTRSPALKRASGNRAGRCEKALEGTDVAAMNSGPRAADCCFAQAGRSHVQAASPAGEAMAERPVQARRERPQVRNGGANKTAASLTQSIVNVEDRNNGNGDNH